MYLVIEFLLIAITHLKKMPSDSVKRKEKTRAIGVLKEVGENDEMAHESSDDEEQKQSYEDVAELKASQLLRLTHVHLDREHIGEIDNLDTYLGDVTHLYLQHNLIKRIENLEFLHRWVLLL